MAIDAERDAVMIQASVIIATYNRAERLRSCLQALSALEDLRLVIRQRGGRDHLFNLNREHRLVQDGILPLLEVEAGFARAVQDMLAGRLKREVLSLILFGSVAREEESARSDLDLCLIVSTSAEKGKALERVHALAPTVLQRYGVRISPIAFTLRQFRLAARRKRSPVREIVSEGIVLVGKQLKGLLSGKG